MKLRSSSDRLPSWDLSDLFSGIDDPSIERMLKRLRKKAEAFSKRYKGTVKRMIKPVALFGMIKEYESLLESSVKPEIYATLVFSADSKNPKHGAFYQKMKQE